MKVRYRRIHQVIGNLKDGNSTTVSIASAGVGRSTWYGWEKKYPRLKLLRERAAEISDIKRLAIIEDALFNAAKAGNITAQIFFLKNRDPIRWRDRTDPLMVDNSKHAHFVNIYLPEKAKEQDGLETAATTRALP